MNQRFNIVQCNHRVAGGSDKARFDVIDGQVSPAGHPVMPYTVLRDWLPLEAARTAMNRFNASVTMARRPLLLLNAMIERVGFGELDLTQETYEALLVERLPYLTEVSSRDLTEAYPALGMEWEAAFARDEGQYAIKMSGYYTAAELRAQLEELERANSVWEPSPPTTKEQA